MRAPTPDEAAEYAARGCRCVPDVEVVVVGEVEYVNVYHDEDCPIAVRNDPGWN